MRITIHTGDPDRLDKLDSFLEYPELTERHPKLQVEWVEHHIAHSDRLPEFCWSIVTNSDHIINRFRVAKKNKEIDELVIMFYPFDSEEVIEIKTDRNGELSDYPDDLLSEWSNQLFKLL